MKTKPQDIGMAIAGALIFSSAAFLLTSPRSALNEQPAEIPAPEPEQAEATYPVQWNSNTTILYGATNNVDVLYTTNLVITNHYYYDATNFIVTASDRIVQELIDNGFTPEDAREVYRIISEMASEKREHIVSPGTRNKEPNRRRFPLFEE